jgi:hypothetical protein
VTKLSRDLEEARKGTRPLTLADISASVDPEAAEMMAEATAARINNLKGYTPNQKKIMLARLVGEKDKRNVIALSRKAAAQIGLDKTLTDLVFEILEAGDPAEMANLLKEGSGPQGKTVLSREDAIPNEAK